MMNRYTSLVSALMLTVASLTSVFAVQAQAADYPSHPIKIIVPFSPGGSTDN
jgi:tripartite-type tricarboxylate transporter receptor subunit TctC